MKRALVLLAVLSLSSVAVSAQEAAESRALTFRFSGSVMITTDPTAAPFIVVTSFGGKGTLGQVTGQGAYRYAPLGMSTPWAVGAGQVCLRVEATGDLLLLDIDPGPTGPVGPGHSWTQTWTGKVVGGTGRFASAKGTFTKTARGFGYGIGAVQLMEGTIEATLDARH